MRFKQLRTVVAVLVAVIVRPKLWPTALRVMKRFVPNVWWTRKPYLPLPDMKLLRFRIVTQYGDPGAPVSVEDTLAWLRWCKAQQQLRS